MPLSTEDFNKFAIKLTDDIRRRAMGAGPGSERIVKTSPSDFILTGFLTASSEGVSEAVTTEEQAELELENDLPSDSPYEQSSIGVEWLSPLEEIRKIDYFSLSASFAIYTRVLPTFREQTHNMGGRTYDKSCDGYVVPMVPVWDLIDLGSFDVSVDVQTLLRERKITITLRDLVSAKLKTVSRRAFYSRKSQINIPEQYLSDEGHYISFTKTLNLDMLNLSWAPTLDIRISSMPSRPEVTRVSVRMTNQTNRPDNQQLAYCDANLYRASMSICIPRSAWMPMIFRELPKSYRYNREYHALGVNCHVGVYDQDTSITMVTEPVPIKEVPRIEPRRIPDASPDFEVLMTDPIPVLNRILYAMRNFDEWDWKAKIDSLASDEERQEAIADRYQFQTLEISRFERGIKLLSDGNYHLVLEAFKFMNETMYRLGRSNPSKRITEWRLFQLVFIVIQIPALARREYPHLELDENDESVDILWFAAGGGKTEAFLGLILWQAFFDRLRKKLLGVTAVIRYPLRLLTFQQMQRISRVLGVAEIIRTQHKLGGAKFSLGYFVGSGGTPNSVSDVLHNQYSSGGVPKELQQIFICPFCSLPSVHLNYNASLRLIEHKCSNSKCHSKGQRLPIYIVDDDVYRYLPTVVVSTVDKFAQFGQNQRFTNLLGRFNMVCPLHGASFYDSNKKNCPAAKESAGSSLAESCGANQVRVGPFHDPGPALLVQDELHLLSEELGAFDSHYESAIVQTFKSFGLRPWKVIAATATIERFDRHAWNLYLKKAIQFPAPGPDAFRTFYFEQMTNNIGRIFMGVVGIGRKHTPAVTRMLTLTYESLQFARDLVDKDIQLARKHFNTGDLTISEFHALIFNYELPLTYVLTRKGSDQVAEAIETRVKQDLRDYDDLTIETFNGGVDLPEMIQTMESINTSSIETPLAERVRGLVTTNIIGHGVDVDRFNIIVFAGFTRLVAEYIQASARVGRTHPGISIFVATPQSERDRSIFDRFTKFHEYLDRLVDPSAINRWPIDALRRTVPGILAGYLMGVAAFQIGTRMYWNRDVKEHYGTVGAEVLNRESIFAWVNEAFGVNESPNPGEYKRALRSITDNLYNAVLNGDDTQSSWVSIRETLSSMRSLRDTDDPAFIQVERSTKSVDDVILRGFVK